MPTPFSSATTNIPFTHLMCHSFPPCCLAPPNQQVVLTPHVYPPTITGATFLGKDLWEQSRTAFGYLQSPGYCGTPFVQAETVAVDEDEEVTVATSAFSFIRKMLEGVGQLLGSATATSTTTDSSTTSANSTTGSNSTAEATKPPAAAPVAPGTQKKGCTVFPVVIGETGSNMQSATDRYWLQDFADFINAEVSWGVRLYVCVCVCV